MLSVHRNLYQSARWSWSLYEFYLCTLVLLPTRDKRAAENKCFRGPINEKYIRKFTLERFQYTTNLSRFLCSFFVVRFILYWSFTIVLGLLLFTSQLSFRLQFCFCPGNSSLYTIDFQYPSAKSIFSTSLYKVDFQ